LRGTVKFQYDVNICNQAASLLCTDMTAQGLEFSTIHLVIQLDCPEDANTYIHRVEKTAR